jgi:hypothetical protein
MATDLLTRPEDLVAQWRTSTDDNPAGPLFSNPFAEADLTTVISYVTACSSCSASRTGECC